MSAFYSKLQELIQQERAQGVLWTPVCLAFGIAAYFGCTREPPIWLGAAMVLAASLIVWLVRKTDIIRVVALILLLAAVGFTATQIRTHFVATPVLQTDTKPLHLSGRVTDFNQTANAVQMTLDHVQIESMAAAETPINIRLRLRSLPTDIHPGDYVTALAMLRPPTIPTYPGSYDFARDSYYKSIGAIGFTLGDIHLDPDHKTDRTNTFLETVRQKINIDIANIVTDPPERSIVQALISGEASSIPDEAADSLRNSGLYHIISISGLHIAFTAGIVFLLVRWLLTLNESISLRWPTKKIAAVFALAAIIAYTLLVGSPVATQRSTLMAGIVLFAMMLDRVAVSIRIVSVSAFLILMIEPETLLSASFQLSFSAVAGLIAAYEAIHHYLRDKFTDSGWIGRILKHGAELALTSLIAGLSTAPLVIYHFQNTQIYGVLANMVGVPLTGLVIMPFALLTYFVMPFGLEKWPLLGAAKGVHWLLEWSDWVSSLPGAVIRMPAAPPIALLLFSLGLCFLFFWKTRLRWAGLIMIVIGFILIPLQTLPDLIIAPEGKVIAARLDNGAYAFRRRSREGFFTEAWLRRMGQSQIGLWPKDGEIAENIACDPNGCLIKRGKQTIVIAINSAGFFEECGKADIIVSLHQYGLHCDASNVIDTSALNDTGTAAVFLTGQNFNLKTVQGKRGQRPWNVGAQEDDDQ